MGTKHDLLSEQEMFIFDVHPYVKNRIAFYLNENSKMKPSDINILDWGCGRGRSVAKLRESGFNAYGVDIDEKTMANGFNLFKERGYKQKDLIRHVDDTIFFEDNFFHIIFSEQVIEHIEDLSAVIREQARLTSYGGLGVHCFPNAKMLYEDHLKMPFVHWLPKNKSRKYWIKMMLILGGGPKPEWKETENKSLKQQAEIYVHYLNNHTHYRDYKEICKIFNQNNFEVKLDPPSIYKVWKKFLPNYLSRNGFPFGGARICVIKN